MNILAIDPGPEASAWVLHCGSGALVSRKESNHKVLASIDYTPFDYCAIEMIASYGMAVGREVFETCLWIGRFLQVAGEHRTTLVYRRSVKEYLCASVKAKDSNIRQALIDRYGPGKEKAIGTKKTPGPLYGIAGDEWSALAVAVTFADTRLKATA